MTDFSCVKFPAAYYAAGRAYMLMHRHSDAVAMAKLGLDMLGTYSSGNPLCYPGTKTVIEDALPGVIEVRKHS